MRIKWWIWGPSLHHYSPYQWFLLSGGCVASSAGAFAAESNMFQLLDLTPDTSAVCPLGLALRSLLCLLHQVKHVRRLLTRFCSSTLQVESISLPSVRAQTDVFLMLWASEGEEGGRSRCSVPVPTGMTPLWGKMFFLLCSVHAVQQNS